MKVEMVWKNCTFHNQTWSNRPVDSYWVLCTYDELKSKVLPLVSNRVMTELIQRVLKSYDKVATQESQAIYERYYEKEDNAFTLLVSKDLHSIQLMPFHYPYANHWNAYSPFTCIPVAVINHLHELTGVSPQ